MSSPIYMSFMSEIAPVTAQALMGQIGQILNKRNDGQNDHDELHLLLSTPGGQVREGLAIYNLLRSLPIKVITYNVGSVNSIGNVIFLAGEERYAAPTSSFMFHGVGFDIQNQRFEEKDVRERLESLKNDQKLISDVIADRTNIDAEETHKLFLEAAFLRADDAITKGIIHDVTDIKVPNGAPFVQFVFK